MERSIAFPYTSVSIKKGSLLVALDYGQPTYLVLILIKNNKRLEISMIIMMRLRNHNWPLGHPFDESFVGGSIAVVLAVAVVCAYSFGLYLFSTWSMYLYTVSVLLSFVRNTIYRIYSSNNEWPFVMNDP